MDDPSASEGVDAGMLPNRADYGRMDFTPRRPVLTQPGAAYGSGLAGRLMRGAAAIGPTDPKVAPNSASAFLLGALGGVGQGARSVVGQRQQGIEQGNEQEKSATDEQNKFDEEAALTARRQFTNDTMIAKQKASGNVVVTPELAQSMGWPADMIGKYVSTSRLTGSAEKAAKDQIQQITKGSPVWKDLQPFMSPDQQARASSGGLHQGEIKLLYQEASKHLALNPAQNAMLTPKAIDFWARYAAASGGNLPALGMSKQGANLRVGILNRTAEVADGTDLASNRALYGAESKSLATQVAGLHAINAYEGTARANYQVLKDKLAATPDSGSKLLNQPYRAVLSQLFGSSELSAFEMALQTASTEFSRILTSGATINNAPLTDSARHDVASVLGHTATTRQLLSAFEVLLQDADNRKASYEAELAATRHGVGNVIPNQQGGAPAAPASTSWHSTAPVEGWQKMIYKGETEYVAPSHVAAVKAKGGKVAP